jgi:hypothetical protein
MERTADLAQSGSALAAWFSPVEATPARSVAQPFSESDLTGISDALSHTGKLSWSRIPRVYSVLRMINQLQLIDSFVTEGINDLSFPFTIHTLPTAIKEPSIRALFIKAQNAVLTKGLDIEKDSGRHRHFLNQADIPFVRIAVLGQGAYGRVEHVRSTISGREYARKLIRRARTFGKDKKSAQTIRIRAGYS